VKTRITKLLIGLSAYPANQRELDDQAIEALCFLLDRGGTVGSCSGLDGTRGALWSTILRRRITGKYPKVKYQKTTPGTWRNRHFHVRQLAHPEETLEQSAAHVAKIWHDAGHAVEANSLKDAATRKEAKDEALQWIDNIQKSTEPLVETQSVTNVRYDAAKSGGMASEWIDDILEPRTPIPADANLFYEALDSAITQIAKDSSLSKKVKGTTVV